MRRPRLVVVAHSAWLGGAERSLVELAEALRDAWDVCVVVPREGPLVARLEAAGARCLVVPARWWVVDAGEEWRWPDLAGTWRTTRAVRSLRPDVVVSSTVVHPHGAVAAWLLGRPHVWWVHEHGGRDHGFRFLLGERPSKLLVRLLSRRVVVCSDAVGDALARIVGRRRTVVVRYAVEVDGPPPTLPRARAPRDPLRLALVGRVRPSKGQADAVAAVGLLAAAGRDVVLELVGDGAPEDLGALRALAAAAGVADRVVLTGPVDEPLAHVDAADVVLMCSRDEAFGRVTVEALKRERPVVGVAGGGTLELIDDGRTGRLCAPGDPDALADAIAELADDPARARRMAAAGRRAAEALCSTAGLARDFGAVLEAARR